MTRQASGAYQHNRIKSKVPKEGTKLRNCYDALRRGEQVCLGGSSVKVQLRDFYGMVVNLVPDRPGYVYLVGEYDGVDFKPVGYHD